RRRPYPKAPHRAGSVRLSTIADRGGRRPWTTLGGRACPLGIRALHPGDRAGQAVGGGLPPRAAAAPPDPQRVGGAVPAPAPPGRGPPVRRDLSPPEASEA